jgi:hypothetical protein
MVKQTGGNKVLDVVLWIFAGVGIVAVVYLIIVYVTNLISSSGSSTSVVNNPPNEYMVKGGLDCPDYWIKQGTTSDGKVQCKNTYKLPLGDYCQDVITFSEVSGKKWINSEDRSTILGVEERCKWLNKCGGVWQGVQDYC